MNIPENLLKQYHMENIDEMTDGMNDADKESYICEEWMRQTRDVPDRITEELVENLSDAGLSGIIKAFVNFLSTIRGEYSEVLTLRKQARAELAELNGGNHE